MADILTAVSSVVTSATGWLGTYATVLAENDILLLLCVGVPLVGLGVGLLRRMISL